MAALDRAFLYKDYFSLTNKSNTMACGLLMLSLTQTHSHFHSIVEVFLEYLDLHLPLICMLHQNKKGNDIGLVGKSDAVD